MKLIDKVKNTVKAGIRKYENYRKYKTKYRVEGTKKNCKIMLYVLAGYKPYLWHDVFNRINSFRLSDMDICIASSGKYCIELSEICKKNNWVYISTNVNNVCVASNIIVREFTEAEYIFKLDEDVYIPKNYFRDMLIAYDKIEANEPAEVGYICPMLPLGFYGMHDFLLRKNLLDEFQKKFGKHKIGGEPVNPFLRKGAGIDEYIWNKTGIFDKCAEEYAAEKFQYEPCASRPGIAAILFKKKLWKDIGGLKRPRGVGVGEIGDEGQITTYCALNYRIAYCIRNILVGHFAFGGSEQNVLKLKEMHPEYFEMYTERDKI